MSGSERKDRNDVENRRTNNEGEKRGGGGGGRKQPRGKILDHRPLSLQQHTTTSEYMIKK